DLGDRIINFMGNRDLNIWVAGAENFGNVLYQLGRIIGLEAWRVANGISELPDDPIILVLILTLDLGLSVLLLSLYLGGPLGNPGVPIDGFSEGVSLVKVWLEPSEKCSGPPHMPSPSLRVVASSSASLLRRASLSISSSSSSLSSLINSPFTGVDTDPSL
ncbi:hypothetical protein BGX27_007025, partial [Mortierella sp. AM989]